MQEPGLNRVIRAAYQLLGLQTFFTAGPKEVRAWTVRAGATAPQAAGVIHTDFERGFIRAEVIAFDDYLAAKARPARARPASCGWRARNMWSRKATSCTSASMFEGKPGGEGSLTLRRVSHCRGDRGAGGPDTVPARARFDTRGHR